MFQWHALFSSIFYIFAINTSLENESITSQQRYESKWHKEMKNNNQCESVTQSIQLVFFAIFCQLSMRQHFAQRRTIFVSKSAINQNASINKNSKNSNSRSLKQHTFAKSISFCCFCFCSAREIDRFIILICKYLSRRSRSKFSTRFSFSWFYILCFRFSFSVFAFISSRLSHLFELFCFCHDQIDIWVTVNEFFRNVDR